MTTPTKKAGKARKSFGNNPANVLPETNSNMQRCLELRIRGYSFEAIAKQLNISAASVYNYVKKSLEIAKADYTERSSELLDIELKRCDRMITALQEFCIPADEVPLDMSEIRALPEDQRAEALEKLFKPSLKAMDAMEKLLDRRAKLLGFYKSDDGATKAPLVWSDDEPGIDIDSAAGQPAEG